MTHSAHLTLEQHSSEEPGTVTKRRKSNPSNPDYAKKTYPKVQELHLMLTSGLNIWESAVLTGLSADDVSKMRDKGWV